MIERENLSYLLVRLTFLFPKSKEQKKTDYVKFFSWRAFATMLDKLSEKLVQTSSSAVSAPFGRLYVVGAQTFFLLLFFSPLASLGAFTWIFAYISNRLSLFIEKRFVFIR